MNWSETIEREYKQTMTLLARKHPAMYIFAKHLDIVYIDAYFIEALPGVDPETGQIKPIEVRTIAFTTGKHIVLFKDWFEAPMKDRFTTLLHEIWHAFLRHPTRMAKLIQKYEKILQPKQVLEIVANEAYDIKVDHYYIERLGYNMGNIPYGLTKEDVEKLSAEEIFEKLLEQARQRGQQLMNMLSGGQADGDQKQGQGKSCGCGFDLGAGLVLFDVEELKKKFGHKQLNKGSDSIRNAKDMEELEQELQKAAKDSLLMAKELLLAQ
jgi:hypothetical protein